MSVNVDINTRLPGWQLLVRSCLALLLGGLANFFVKLYRIRSKFQRMQNDGLPMPPHHPVFGHLKLVAGVMSKVPRNAHSSVLSHQINRLFPDLGATFYIDTWPFGPPLLVIAGPSTATQALSLPKYHRLRQYMLPMTGGNDLVTMEGSE
ncbi:hypothetical protein BP5796_13121 [Coleophoma crateriformis]|uniref:Uncharacterized protein n=1 Tax=Coleophoma crateriformis TaxID=565419 RepID=A0A3D8Q463_9HELO|nr:hypothetical protein BP5796_13121 [Coleophoma crateriformis]